MNAHDLELFAAVRRVITAFNDLGVEYFAYLREWAVRLGLTDLLLRALADTGLPPEG